MLMSRQNDLCEAAAIPVTLKLDLQRGISGVFTDSAGTGVGDTAFSRSYRVCRFFPRCL